MTTRPPTPLPPIESVFYHLNIFVFGHLTPIKSSIQSKMTSDLWNVKQGRCRRLPQVPLVHRPESRNDPIEDD